VTPRTQLRRRAGRRRYYAFHQTCQRWSFLSLKHGHTRCCPLISFAVRKVVVTTPRHPTTRWVFRFCFHLDMLLPARVSAQLCSCPADVSKAREGFVCGYPKFSVVCWKRTLSRVVSNCATGSLCIRMCRLFVVRREWP
jgi:hypothetical protein